MRTVFDKPTVRELGAWIAEKEAETTHDSAIPPIASVGANEAPLSFAQEGLWIFDQLDHLIAIGFKTANLTFDAGDQGRGFLVVYHRGHRF